jgi:hypothetical protein
MADRQRQASHLGSIAKERLGGAEHLSTLQARARGPESYIDVLPIFKGGLALYYQTFCSQSILARLLYHRELPILVLSSIGPS